MPDMDAYAPFDTGTGSSVTTEVWRSFMRRMTLSGVVRDVGEELEVYADSTGMQVKIKPGEVLIQGHWARNLSEKTVAVPSSHPSLARRDLVVARANLAERRIEYAVKAGTPGSPTGIAQLQQDAVIWEVALACIRVPANAATIASTDILNFPQWGGVIAPTTMDDWLMHEDKASTVSRGMVNQDVFLDAGASAWFRMRTNKTITVKRLRTYVTNRRTAGTCSVRVYYGLHQTRLSNWFDANTWSPGSFSTEGMHECTSFTPVTMSAGTEIAVYIRGNGTLAGASPANKLYFAGTGPVSYLPSGVIETCRTTLNPSLTWSEGAYATSGYADAAPSIPTYLDLLDGTWNRNDRIAWFALSGDLG